MQFLRIPQCQIIWTQIAHIVQVEISRPRVFLKRTILQFRMSNVQPFLYGEYPQVIHVDHLVNY